MNAPADKISSRKIWRNRVLQLLLFILFIAGIRAWQQRDMVSGLAPPLSGVKLDGSTYVLPAKPAQPVLVHFWATWCAICRVDQDSIDSIAQDHPNTITVAMQSGSDAEVGKHLTAQSLHFPVLNDADGRLSAAWGVHAVPASFIVAPDGKIRFIEVGYTTGIGLRLRLWLAGLPG
jgi:thiol-disulfide isomerase/thioredoxin